MNKLEFTCPECGSHRLDEVMVNVTVSSEIVELNDTLDFDYDDAVNCDGEIDSYRCIQCGYMIEEEEILIDTPEELVKWIEKQNKRAILNGGHFPT